MTWKRTTRCLITTPWQQDLESSPGVNRSHLCIITLLDCAKQVSCPVPCKVQLTTHAWKCPPSKLALAGNSSGRISEAVQQTAEWNLTLLIPFGTPGPWLKELSKPGNQTRSSFLTNAKWEDKDTVSYYNSFLPSSTKLIQTEHKSSCWNNKLGLPTPTIC